MIRKNYLGIFSLAILAISPAVLADVQVYGKANVSLQNAKEGSDEKVELVSNASQIGIQGSEQLDGLKAIYRFEYQTEVDDGVNATGQTFAQRNIYVGLQGSAGTLIAGNFDTPTRALQEKVDLFNDLEGDIVVITRGEIRAKNIVQVASPSLAGFVATAAFVGKETDGTNDGYSGSFSYTNNLFYIGLSADSDVEAVDVDLVRAVIRVTLGPVQLGALAEQVDNGVAEEEGGLVSALWNISPKWAAKLQYGESDTKMPGGETVSAGIDYKLSASTILYSYYTEVENDVLLVPTAPRDDKYAGLGILLKF